MKFCLYSTFISNQWTKKRVIVASEVMIVMRLGTYGCHLFMVHDSALCFFEKNIYCKLHTVIRLYLYIYPSIYEYLFMYIYIHVETGTFMLIPSRGLQYTCTLSSEFSELRFRRDGTWLIVAWSGLNGSRRLLICPVFWCWNGSQEYYRLVTSKAKRMIGVQCLADICWYLVILAPSIMEVEFVFVVVNQQSPKTQVSKHAWITDAVGIEGFPHVCSIKWSSIWKSNAFRVHSAKFSNKNSCEEPHIF